MKKYNTIVIDPPWNIQMVGGGLLRENRATKLPYKTMTLQKIKEFPIENFSNIGCHIYMWTTNAYLRKAFEIFESWNVNFHLCLVWCKPSMIAPLCAYQFATEFCLLGFYKKPMQKFLGKVNLNWFKGFNKAGKHSSKPNIFYDIVRDMSPPPRIDIFSRRCIAGFDSWGDEAPNEKQKTLKGELQMRTRLLYDQYGRLHQVEFDARDFKEMSM